MIARARPPVAKCATSGAPQLIIDILGRHGWATRPPAIEQCAAEGKNFESCKVAQTYRVKYLRYGPDWYDYVGDPSCSCEDPDKNKCKQLPRTRNPIPW